MGRPRIVSDEERRLRHLKYAKAWKIRNKERVEEYRRIQYAENKEEIKGKVKEWYASNRELALSRAAKQNLSKFGLSQLDYDALFLLQEGKCAICGEPPI